MDTNMFCPCCMEKHATKIIHRKESNIFKELLVEYDAQYSYCEQTKEIFEDENQISVNDISMKDAYREKKGLLKSSQISDIRSKYAISQSDLCILLGWGQKTITRYESHQIQDNAHDTILRKLDSDPEWFIELLNRSKDSLSPRAYSKCSSAARILFEKNHDNYLKSAIMSKYARFIHDPDSNGNKELSLGVVIDMIHYFANSEEVTALYLVKLLKMLWYADSLSYKRYGHAISGLVYRSLPMGAVPVAYESIIDLSSIPSEMVDFGNGIGQKFTRTDCDSFPNLTQEDMDILDFVANRFGKTSTKLIIETMQNEDSYKRTKNREVILYRYANMLSLS